MSTIYFLKQLKLVRGSATNIAKALYKQVNASKNDEFYYERHDHDEYEEDDEDEKEKKENAAYVPVGYTAIRLAKCLDVDSYDEEEGLFITTRIDVIDGVETKELRICDFSEDVFEYETLPNGHITHKVLTEYVTRLMNAIKQRIYQSGVMKHTK